MRNMLVMLGVVACSVAAGADWPMYRGSPSRSGYVPHALPGQLKPIWKRRSLHPPERAWPRSKRQLFDACYQPVVCRGRVFYGSSVDCSVRCLDGETGKQLWQFVTGGPIRFAPVAWADRVAVASDGAIYVSDFSNHAIRRIANGVVTTVAGGEPGYLDGPTDAALFEFPIDVAVDAFDNVWVSDNQNRAIRLLTP